MQVRMSGCIVDYSKRDLILATVARFRVDPRGTAAGGREKLPPPRNAMQDVADPDLLARA